MRISAPSRVLLNAQHLRVCAYIIVWFIANGTTIMFNKYIFAVMDFRCPLTLTLLHMSMQSVLAMLTIDTFGLVEKVQVEQSDYISKLIPISVTFCLNICLGNVSIRYVPVSFMQTIKAGTPVAAAVIQYAYNGARLTPAALASLVPITGGLALASVTELEFHLGGFIAALVSCVLTATKFVLSSQMLGGRYKLDSINMLYYMAPPSVMLLLPACVFFESVPFFDWVGSKDRTMNDFGFLIVSALVSFGLNAALFMVLKATSSITVTVAGNVKTVSVICVSIWYFQNPITFLNVLGCASVFGGCLWYGLVKEKWSVKPVHDYRPPLDVSEKDVISTGGSPPPHDSSVSVEIKQGDTA